MDKNKDNENPNLINVANKVQCQFFVIRKKRFCRMTVRPGRQYCGEHEPPPDDAQADKRVSCPNDPKHTVYVSKLEKHLSICNARRGALPVYIVPHVNTPTDEDDSPRVPLALVPRHALIHLIQKINHLYDEHVKNNITMAADRPIHPAVISDFNDPARTESSRRHLRQASRLMWLVEDEGLVDEDTCYVELGAGKGQLSYYMGVSWCEGSSRVLPVDRAALRHKRERRGRGKPSPGAGAPEAGAPRAGVPRAVRAGAVERVRADLAHLSLELVPHVTPARHIVGLAKHLCGAATDYAVRCVSEARRARGLVLATCCHHRCEGNAYLGRTHLQELGISVPEVNIMLGVVSWATCGDGRSRDAPAPPPAPPPPPASGDPRLHSHPSDHINDTCHSDGSWMATNEDSNVPIESRLKLSREYRETVGRRAKALLDWGRVLRLRAQGFDAGLCYYVPTGVSLENVCIIAKKPPAL